MGDRLSDDLHGVRMDLKVVRDKWYMLSEDARMRLLETAHDELKAIKNEYDAGYYDDD